MRRFGGRAALAVFTILVGAGCGSPRTEVLVVVDTDLDVPREIGQIEIVATSPSDSAKVAEASLSGADDLPATLGLAYRGGPLGPFGVEARGLLGPIEVVSRNARFYFERQKTLVLTLHLLRSCRGEQCRDGETCGEEGCRSVDVSAGELTPWEGAPPRIGDPLPDGDGDVDSDADGDVDSGADGDVDGDADSSPDGASACSGAEVDWDGTCMAPSDLGDCARDCDFGGCNNLDEVACLDFDGDFLCVGRPEGEPWESCGRGW